MSDQDNGRASEGAGESRSALADQGPRERHRRGQEMLDAERARSLQPAAPRPWTGPPPAKVSDEQYARFSLAERAVYTQRHVDFAASGAAAQPGEQGQGDPAKSGTPTKIGEVEVSEAELRSFLADKAARESGTLTAPANAAEYKLELPPSFERPPGAEKAEFKFNPDAVEALQFREWAARNKLSQDAFSEVLSIYAASQLRQQMAFKEAEAHEFASLGAAGPDRIAAASRWLRAILGDATAKPIIATMSTRAHVEGFERLMARFRSQGAGSFSQQGRDTTGQEVSDEQYQKMSYAEKMQYAEQNRNGAQQ